MRLTNEQRRIARKAITAHLDWQDYREQRGITASDLTSVEVQRAAEAMNIDLRHVLGLDVTTPNKPAQVFDTPKPRKKPDMEAMTDNNAANSLDAIIQGIAAQTAKDVAANAINEQAVIEIAEREFKKLLAQSDRPERVVLQKPEGVKVEIEERVHPKFADLLQSVTAKTASNRHINVFLSGPTGSGKTHAARQIAKTLDMQFFMLGAMTMPHEVTGFVDAGGTYHDTHFTNAYRNGGLILIDEADASTNEALLPLNAALDGDVMPLPTGDILERHPDFMCIGAGNTFGQGATAEFVGRNKLDAAFLSRFPAKMSWGYDEELERDICGNADWAKEVQRARKVASDAGLKINIDPRHSIAGAALVATGMTRDKVAEYTYLSGLTVDQVAIIKAGV